MNLTDLKSRLKKAEQHFVDDLMTVRAGRAVPSIIENVLVEAYQSKMSIKELGSISVLDSSNLAVEPWDKSLVGSIAKAIRISDLNLNPVEDGFRVRVPIPMLTEERRVELTKIVSRKAEEARQVIRNIRQDAMKALDKEQLSEDDKYRTKEEVEKTVKEFIEAVDKKSESKRQDLMTV